MCVVDDAVMHVECRGAAVPISIRYACYCTWRSKNARIFSVCVTDLIQVEGDFFLLNTNTWGVCVHQIDHVYPQPHLWCQVAKKHLLPIATIKENWEMSWVHKSKPDWQVTSQAVYIDSKNNSHWLDTGPHRSLPGTWMSCVSWWDARISEEHWECRPDHQGASNVFDKCIH